MSSHVPSNSMPPSEETLEVAVQKMRIEMRHISEAVNELRAAEVRRAESARNLLIGALFAFLVPTIVAVWYGGALSARIDYHEYRIKTLEGRP